MRVRYPLLTALFPLFFCLALLFAPPARSEEAFVTAAPEIVTGSRLSQSLDEVPAPTDVITSADIANSGAKSLSEILDRVPGISTLTRAGSTQEDNLKVRGLVTEVLFLVDGVPYYKASHGAGAAAVDLRSIPVESIERIEIVRGAGSALYGSMAAGGVINIVTKKPEKTGVSIYAEGGSQDWRRYGFRASATGENTGVTAWATHREDGRSRLLLNNGVQEDNISYREDAGGLRFVSGAWSVGGEWGNAASEWEFYGLNQQEDDWSRYVLAYDDGTTRFSLYRHTNQKIMKYYGVEYPYEDTAWGAELSRRFDWAGWAVSLGAAYRDEAMEASDFPGVVLDGSRSNVAPFVEFSRPLGEVLLDAGLRYETWDVRDGDDQDELTPRLSLSWQAPNGNLWFLSAGRFFAMPSLYELVAVYPVKGGTTTPSPNLKPEKGISYELGVKGRDDRGRWSAGLFFLNMEDKIDYNGDPGEPTYVNLSKFRSLGLEASREFRLSDSLRWETGLTWMRAEVKETEDGPWLREGSPSWSIDNTWTWTAGPWEAAFALHYLGDRKNERQGIGPECQGDATTADLRLAYSMGDGRRAVLSVTNLFDEDVVVQDSIEYNTRYFGPERRVTLSWQWAF